MPQIILRLRCGPVVLAAVLTAMLPVWAHAESPSQYLDQCLSEGYVPRSWELNQCIRDLRARSVDLLRTLEREVGGTLPETQVPPLSEGAAASATRVSPTNLIGRDVYDDVNRLLDPHPREHPGWRSTYP